MLFYNRQQPDFVGLRQEADQQPRRQCAHMRRMREMVEVAVEMLHAGRLADFASFCIKLEAEETPGRRHEHATIDRIYDDARRAGALGGKLLAPVVRVSWCSWFPRIGNRPFVKRCRISSPFPFRSISRARRSSTARKTARRRQAAVPSDIFAGARKRAAKE